MALQREIPMLEIDSLEQPFTETALSRMARLLPEFIGTRRWFRSKARQIQSVEIRDVLAVGSEHYILVSRIQFADGGADEYVLAVGLAAFSDGDYGQSAGESDSFIAGYKAVDGSEGNVYDAFSDPRFRASLLNAIACETIFHGRNGDLIASRTSAFGQQCETRDLELDSQVSKAEQSNTSIVYGNRFILKLFRKLEQGTNPDVEIGVFLTERGFKNTPAFLGTFEYRSNTGGEPYGAGILQDFVRNQGDSWKFTLGELGGFFSRALSSNELAPALEHQHPIDLMTRKLSTNERSLLGNYVDSVRLLGVRTAEMHRALAGAQQNPDFVPEPFSPEDGVRLYAEMSGQADTAFELLRRKEAVLAGAAAEDAHSLLRWEHRVADRFSALRDQRIEAVRIRFHGDFHLGQVLYTGTDFMIIDFEGEPARPLSERRFKGLGMRDVAGMLRSFQYAAYAALFGQVPGVPTKPEMMSAVESWADFWTARASAVYLGGYFSAVDGLSFVPADIGQRRILLDAFLLQKALYEVAYELNNRPDWVRIPLRGILSLLSDRPATHDAAAS